MAALVFSFPGPFAAVDYGAVGGCLLLLDLLLFTTVVSFWEAAEVAGRQSRKR